MVFRGRLARSAVGAARTLQVGLAVMLWAAPTGAALNSSGTGPVGEGAVRDVIASYEQAIETKDLELFRSVKPNLSPEEERRLEVAFESTGSHEVFIKIVSIQIDGERAVARIARRDTLEGSIVSSFPQTLKMVWRSGGWVIDEIGR